MVGLLYQKKVRPQTWDSPLCSAHPGPYNTECWLLWETVGLRQKDIPHWASFLQSSSPLYIQGKKRLKTQSEAIDSQLILNSTVIK